MMAWVLLSFSSTFPFCQLLSLPSPTDYITVSVPDFVPQIKREFLMRFETYLAICNGYLPAAPGLGVWSVFNTPFQSWNACLHMSTVVVV
jgi:hypothetical protein